MQKSETYSDEIPIGSQGDERQLLTRLVAQYGAPAYVRRARQVQDALDDLIEHCGRQRNEKLTMVRSRLAVLFALAGDWVRIRPLVVDDDQVNHLQEMYASLGPTLRLSIEPTSSRRALARALAELAESIERFNRAWQAFICAVDLIGINKLREEYNRHYLLEKECALRSARLARLGFSKLDPLTVEELAQLFPALPVPIRISRQGATTQHRPRKTKGNDKEEKRCPS